MKQRAEPENGVLYMVGTPIGHLGDLSPRARALLAAVNTVACEDTRHSGQLLVSLGSTARRCSFHQHNTHARIPQLLDELSQGRSVAVISDAGLPGISDPGEELVAAARAAGHAVICIPGPCAATTALVSSGLPSGRFCFEGFLPAKGRDRRQRLETLAKEPRTTVLYEAPHRLLKLLEELQEHCGAARPLQVTRELTKRHEEQV
ncbi:MAG: 16S rRNA (cytidine(1402)-2'-O)-methyltransferase, partial [Cyanobacteriota bacterium]|nr:16S rRNA (cytidine(1402)-2'-O)-methyltransferase [Cyanobacteriota bacterium]